MPKPQLYVFVSDSKIRVTSEQKKFIDEYRASRHVSISQAVRDAIQHSMTCPFFNGNSITGENVPTVRGE